MSTLERAIAIATAAHAGHEDKAGAPYILHPLRVLHRVREAGGGETEMIAAVLHDVVEDSPQTLEQLAEEGFAPDVLDIVEALTKRPDEETPRDAKWDLRPYYRFTARASRTRASRLVKRADLLDNLDQTRIANRGLQDEKRLVRYRRAKGLLETIGRAGGDATPTAPMILPVRNRVSTAKVEAACPGDRPILACDFRIDEAEQGSVEPGGIRLGRVFNVDHHARLEPFYSRRVTSTSLAHDYLARHGAEQARGCWIAINHADCDSMLSSAVLMGHLAPDQRWVEASIAADHTGEENDVADLLQGLDGGRRGRRTEAEYLESLRNLRLLLERGEHALEPVGREALQLRRLRRTMARQFVASGRLVVEDGFAWGELDDHVDGAMIPALVPEAAVILLVHRHPSRPGRRAAKLRLGLAAPPGVTLHSLAMTEWDTAYGGRWNAGSNGRSAGTVMRAEEYAAVVRRRWGAVLARG